MGKRSARHSADIALLSAALRHLRDARHLADPGGGHPSLDQAYHLAGFGPECARKAALAAPWANKLLGHNLGQDADLVLGLALVLDRAAARYELSGWASEYPALADWRPEYRYKKTGTFDRGQVEPLLRDAERAVVDIMAALWTDGRLALESLG